MQTLTNILPPGVAQNAEEQKAANWMLICTIGGLIVCGSFTYSIYPPPVNAAALGIMVGLFYYSLHKHDPVSFFIQLFIGNFFIFGNKFGGNYNIAAFAAIMFYTAINGKIPFLRSSVLDNAVKTAMIIWGVFDLLSVTGGNLFPLAIELQNFFAFFMLLFAFYSMSRVPFSDNDFYKFVVSISLFFGYEFLVAFNQKYELYDSPFPFFPKTNDSIEYDMGIVRSSSTLNNFEAFAEFCMSIISMLIPGILSGSSLKKNRYYYYLSIGTVLVAALSIVLSGTRSSILLLPFAFATVCLMLGRRLKAKLIIVLVSGVLGLFAVNSVYKFMDFSVFEERSEDMDMEHLTFEKLLSGEGMNRGGLFPYAMEQVKKIGIIGRGYCVSPAEYRAVHFKKGDMDDGIADYHNLYMSTYVLFGAVGFFSMMFIFAYSLASGWLTYWKLRHENHFLVDLLLGCNVLFFYLMINQFKIQFIRDINYFTIIMLLLAFYILLTYRLKHSELVTENIDEENKQVKIHSNSL